MLLLSVFNRWGTCNREWLLIYLWLPGLWGTAGIQTHVFGGCHREMTWKMPSVLRMWVKSAFKPHSPKTRSALGFSVTCLSGWRRLYANSDRVTMMPCFQDMNHFLSPRVESAVCTKEVGFSEAHLCRNHVSLSENFQVKYSCLRQKYSYLGLEVYMGKCSLLKVVQLWKIFSLFALSFCSNCLLYSVTFYMNM